MKTRFIIDLANGLVARSIAGTVQSDDMAAALVAGDTMDCEVVFQVDGTDVTATTLAGDVVAALGVRAVPGVEPLLAMSTPIVLEGEVGTCTLDLHTAELMALVDGLGDTKVSTKVWFEAVVGGLTVAQMRMILRREVMAEGDEPPPTAEASRIAASASAAAALASANAAAASAAAAAASASSASSSATAAAAVQTAVSAARDAAQAAQSAAQAAQTAAEAARDDAAGSATAAATARTAAEAARDAAQTAQAAAISAQNAAQTSATAATASATNAANSAVAAATSETNAAASAAAAAASVGTAAAISANLRNPLAPQSGLACDGSSVSNRLTWALPASCALGDDPRGFTIKLETPPAAPASTATLFTWGDAASPTTQFVELAHTSGDALRIRLYGATTADYRERTFAGLISNYGALRTVIMTIAMSSAGLVVFMNGVSVTLSTETTAGTAPADWQAQLVSTVAAFHGGLTYKLHSWWPANFAPTLADALDSYFLGGGVPERYKWARSNLNTYINKAWAYGSLDTNVSDSLGGGIGAWSISAVGGARTGGSGAYVIRGTCTNVSNSAYITHNFPVGTSLRVGQGIRVTVYMMGSTTSNGCRINGCTAGYAISLFNPAPISLAVNSSWTKKTWTATVTGGGTLGCLGFTTSSFSSPTIGDTIDMDDLQIALLGALFFASPHASGDGCGYQIHDLGWNQVDGLMSTSGWTWTHQTPRGFVRGTLTWTGTHEGKSLLGQRVFPDGFVLGTMTLKPTTATSGSGSTIGTTNGATRWRGLTALTANTKSIVTLVNQLPAGTANGDADLVIDPDTTNYTGSISVEAHYTVTLGS